MTLEPRPIAVRLALALLLVLPGCGTEKKAPTKGTAGGEVLEASVSDAMLPLDQVRSQPPLAPRTEGDASKRGRNDDDATDEASGGSADATAEPAGDKGAGAPAPATPTAE